MTVQICVHIDVLDLNTDLSLIRVMQAETIMPVPTPDGDVSPSDAITVGIAQLDRLTADARGQVRSQMQHLGELLIMQEDN